MIWLAEIVGIIEVIIVSKFKCLISVYLKQLQLVNLKQLLQKY